ncbi:MAG: hypothetical protein KJ630_19095 [Proteobacteria bacterium]|nr:hypothetical protein [Pseudomonadota bacterium]
MALNKDGFFTEILLKSEEVDIGGGKTAIVSELGAVDYMNIWTDESVRTDGVIDMEKFSPKLVAFCVVGDDGERLFTSEEDIRKVGRFPHKVLDKLVHAAMKLNGIESEEVKNSEASQTEDSVTGSPSN